MLMAGVDLKALAARGAAARVAELQAELSSLYKAFPGLRKGNIDDPFTRRRIIANTEDGTTILPGRSRRRRKPMSAAQKADVSKRMKAYWAKRRKTSK
jgi:hypothetical protein